MGRRRTDNPLSILVIGFLTMIGFGIAVVHLNRSTPILQLKPDLEQQFKQSGFATRFMKPLGDLYPHIEVLVPPELGTDERVLRDIGLFALERYGKLTEKRGSQVQSCVVHPVDQPQPRVEVTLRQVFSVKRAEAEHDAIVQSLQGLGLRDASVTVEGTTASGARLHIKGRVPPSRTPEKLAKSLLARLTKDRSYLGTIVIMIDSEQGRLTLTGGADAPRQPKQPRKAKPRPGPKPSGAPPASPPPASPEKPTPAAPVAPSPGAPPPGDR